jgi:hypothetical protein
MLVGAWQFLGAIALATSGAALLSRADEEVFGVAAALAWWVWAFGATNLVGDAGRSSSPSLAILGLAFGVLMLLIAWRGAFVAVAPRPTATEREMDAQTQTDPVRRRR